jgi:acetyl-CoA carboxylase biotin carboxyl carrier protein
MNFGMDFNQIQELVRMLSKHKISEFILQEENFKLVIRTSTPADSAAVHTVVQQPAFAPPLAPVMSMPLPAQAPTPPAAPAPPRAETTTPAPAAEENNSRLLAIKSPMVGTFYRSPSPDKGPFVKVGDAVDVGNPVCIIEAMKLFNEIESDIKGKIVKVLVEDASPVEYDQPLFLVDPA